MNLERGPARALGATLALLLPALIAGAATPKAGEKRICVPSADGKSWECGTPDNPPPERGLPADLGSGPANAPPPFLASPPSELPHAYAAPPPPARPARPLPDEFPQVQREEAAPAADTAAAQPAPVVDAPAAPVAAAVEAPAPVAAPAEVVPLAPESAPEAPAPPAFLAAPAPRRRVPLAPILPPAEAAREEALAAAPPVAAAQPVDPQPVAVEAEPVASVAPPAVAEPAPVAVEAEPVASVAPPVIAEPAPVAVEPEPAAVEPQPVMAQTAPVEAAPAAVEAQLEPAASEPIASAPQPVAPAAEAVAVPVAPPPPLAAEPATPVAVRVLEAQQLLRLPANAWTVQVGRGIGSIDDAVAGAIHAGRQVLEPLYLVAVGTGTPSQWLLLWSSFPDADSARRGQREAGAGGVARRVGPLQSEVRAAGSRGVLGAWSRLRRDGDAEAVTVVLDDKAPPADRPASGAQPAAMARADAVASALPADRFERLPATAWSVQLARAGSSSGFDALLTRYGLAPDDCHVLAIDAGGAREYLLLWSQFPDADAARAAARSLPAASGAFVRRVGPLQAEARRAR